MLTFSSKPYIYGTFIFFWFCLNIFIEGDAEIVTLYPMVHDYMQVQVLILDHMYLLSFTKFHIYEHIFVVLAANGLAGIIYSLDNLVVRIFIGEPFTVAVNLAFPYHITHAFAEGSRHLTYISPTVSGVRNSFLLSSISITISSSSAARIRAGSCNLDSKSVSLPVRIASARSTQEN